MISAAGIQKRQTLTVSACITACAGVNISALCTVNIRIPLLSLCTPLCTTLLNQDLGALAQAVPLLEDLLRPLIDNSTSMTEVLSVGPICNLLCISTTFPSAVTSLIPDGPLSPLLKDALQCKVSVCVDVCAGIVAAIGVTPSAPQKRSLPEQEVKSLAIHSKQHCCAGV